MGLYAALKTKTILIIAAIAISFGMVTTLIALHITNQTITRAALKYMEVIVTQQKTAIELVIADSASFVQHLGSQRIIIDYMQSRDPQEQDPVLLDYLHSIDVHDQYQAIYIMNKEGKTLLSTDRSFAGQNYGFRSYFKNAIAGKPTVDAAIGVTSGKFGYYFSHPIKTDLGEIIGVVVVKMKDALIADALKPKDMDGNAMLVDTYGVVIQSNEPNLLFKSLGTLSPEATQVIRETRRFSDIAITSLGYDRVAEKIIGQQETRPFALRETTGEECDELVGVARITDAPFFIITTEAYGLFMESDGNTPAAIGLFAFVIIIAMAIMLASLTAKRSDGAQ